MSNPEDKTTTVIIRRPARIGADDRGRNVWQGDVEEIELELMSTQELRVALAAADDAERQSIAAIAAGDKDGVIARDTSSGNYDVVTRAELNELRQRGDAPASLAGRLDETQELSVEDASGELSLVSTQALRRILNPDVPEPTDTEDDDGGGFNPYDHG